MMTYEAALAIANVIPGTRVMRASYTSSYFIVCNKDRLPANVDNLVTRLKIDWNENPAVSATTRTVSDTEFLQEEQYDDLQSNYEGSEKRIFDDWSDDASLDWSVSFDDRGPGDWENMIEDPECREETDWRGIDVSEEWADPHFGLNHYSP